MAPRPRPRAARWTFPAGPASVRTARRRVLAQVLIWSAALEGAACDNLQVVVSELVTNTVRHAGGLLVSVVADLNEERLRVEVRDGSTAVPQSTGAVREDEESGRGMFLVDALADRHGWETTTLGKCVWAEIDLPGRPMPVVARRALVTELVRLANAPGS
jgi:serine/threonine-protein kinase RsbW